MQDRCPNCGNYWVHPAYTPVNSAWRVFVSLWSVAWSLIAFLIVVVALVVGNDLSWYVAGWMIVPFVAAILIARIPRRIVRNREVNRARASPRRQCRTCGYQWTTG